MLMLSFGFFLSARVSAQRIQARATIDSVNYLIGDQLKVHLELDQPEGIKINFPEIGDSLSSTIEVIERSPLDTFHLDKSEQIKIIQNLTITSFDTGKQVIPPFYFSLKNNGMMDTIESLPVDFFVKSMKIDTTKGPVDIKLPYKAPVNLKEASPYILGILLIASLIFFILYYINRKKHKRSLFGKPLKEIEPPHIVALRSLDQIRNEKLWQQNQIKKYYSKVTETLRIYIQNEFHIKTLECTTDEILSEFRKKKDLIPENLYNELKNILNTADLVKFAKYKPAPDDNEQTLKESYLFVNATKPKIKETEKIIKGKSKEDIAPENNPENKEQKEELLPLKEESSSDDSNNAKDPGDKIKNEKQ